MLTLLNANALNIPLADNSVQCAVTSPPYWGLRDYGIAGQLGMEPTPQDYVADLVAVFREVWRVLRDDGTLWLNSGDTYIGSGGAGGDYAPGGLRAGQPTWKNTYKPRSARQVPDGKNPNAGVPEFGPNRQPLDGLKPKDIAGIPWRVAFALQADGWWLRSDIIWSKPNPMPESVTDRPTKAHEYLFLLAKSERYYYDAEAIKEKAIRAGDIPGGSIKTSILQPSMSKVSQKPVPDFRNRRTVWTVATSPYSGAHFATFPPALVEPCILAGSRPGDIVLDPFSGTGTVGLVSIKHGRSFVGVELNPDYIRLARARTSGIQTSMISALVCETAEQAQLFGDSPLTPGESGV